MFTIITTQGTNGMGRSQVVAKAQGKQRTVTYDPALSVEANHASAVGTLLNVLASPEQQAKVRHPSGVQRVRVEPISEFGGKHRWSIDV